MINKNFKGYQATYTKKRQYHNFAAYCGLVLLQGNFAFSVINGLQIPVLTLVISIFGLLCYLFNAIVLKLKPYIISNSIGLIINSTLLLLAI